MKYYRRVSAALTSRRTAGRRSRPFGHAVGPRTAFRPFEFFGSHLGRRRTTRRERAKFTCRRRFLSVTSRALVKSVRYFIATTGRRLPLRALLRARLDPRNSPIFRTEPCDLRVHELLAIGRFHGCVRYTGLSDQLGVAIVRYVLCDVENIRTGGSVVFFCFGNNRFRVDYGSRTVPVRSVMSSPRRGYRFRK